MLATQGTDAMDKASETDIQRGDGQLKQDFDCFQLRIVFDLLPIKDCLTLAFNKFADGDSNVRLVEVAIEHMSKHDDFNASAPTSDMRTVSY